MLHCICKSNAFQFQSLYSLLTIRRKFMTVGLVWIQKRTNTILHCAYWNLQFLKRTCTWTLVFVKLLSFFVNINCKTVLLYNFDAKLGMKSISRFLQQCLFPRAQCIVGFHRRHTALPLPCPLLAQQSFRRLLVPRSAICQFFVVFLKLESRTLLY